MQIHASIQPINCQNTIDFVESLPKEIGLNIFSYLNPLDLIEASEVNKVYKVLAHDETLWKALPLPETAFGKNAWEKYLGKVEDEPQLPRGIYKNLTRPCPFWPDKKVEETHMLVLIPKTVNGKPLTLNLMEQLVKAPKEGKATKYDFVSETIIDEKGDNPVLESHWVLMTKEVLEETRSLTDSSMKTHVAQLANETKIAYELPNSLEAVACLFARYVCSGERLFETNPPTYTLCQDNAKIYPIMVGGFSSDGLNVDRYCFYPHKNYGAAVLRRFFNPLSFNVEHF